MVTKRQRPATLDGETASDQTTKTGKARRSRTPEVVLPPTLTVKQLGEMLGVSSVEVIKQLMRNGVMAGINQVIDFNLAATVTPAFGVRVRLEELAPSTISRTLQDMKKADGGKQMPRSPVVTILGHVDHGKTTLLDAIRKSRITAGEVGGITQRIGAYQVEYNGRKITFLDTPGHEAFTAIRARGARATDIAVLVVAADDGVMPQTIEAIDHARAAKIPIIVAINKVDKPEANSENAKRQLAEQGLVLEEWGGDVIAVPVSAKNNIGIEDILENILVVAEVAELEADFDRPASGVVIEAELDRNKGPLVTVLVQNGILNVGNDVVAGKAYGRLKAMVNDVGKRIKEVGPSVPVEVLGFNSLPQAGDLFYVTPDDKTARAVAEELLREREAEQNLARALTLEDVMARITAGDVKELNLVLKADVQGSVEAVRTSLERLDSASKARINILHAGSGAITDSDVLLAIASKAIILGFNITVEPSAELVAEREGIEIRRYEVIYHLVEDVTKALQGILEPAYREIIRGRAEVRAVFSSGKLAKAAGCMVLEGRLTRDVAVRVLRDGQTAYEGSIITLRRFKEDVNEVSAGFECGVGIAGFNDFQEGDILEAHRRERARG